MLKALAWVLPQEASVLVIVAIGFAVMVGLRRLALGLSGLLAWLVMTPVIDPLVDLGLSMMPLWALAVGGIGLGLYLLRVVLGTLLGREGAGHVIGRLVVSLVSGMFRLVTLPLRWLLRPRN